MSDYFFDWLECYQDYEFDLPIISPDGFLKIDFLNCPIDDGVVTADIRSAKQNKIHHPGSYDTSIQIQIKGKRLHISGNPSRYNRLDNLFGFTDLDHCVSVYNVILTDLGLPLLTKCTLVKFHQVKHEDGTTTLEPFVNGMIIVNIHLTSNQSVGSGSLITHDLSCITSKPNQEVLNNNVFKLFNNRRIDTYLASLSMQKFRHSKARLHDDGKTVEWRSKLGNNRLVYPSVYDKAHQMMLHIIPRIKRKFGDDSEEYKYIMKLYRFCLHSGVARFELKFKSEYLKRHNLQFYGISDLQPLFFMLSDFVNIDQKLKVNDMNIQTITQTLLDEGICFNTRSANLTASYAINWMSGQKFDLTKSQVRTVRARLRRIGMDIALPCDLSKFSPVIVREVVEIEKQSLEIPDFYIRPSHLRLVA